MIFKCNSCETEGVIVLTKTNKEGNPCCPACDNNFLSLNDEEPVKELELVFNAQGHSGASAQIVAGAFYNKFRGAGVKVTWEGEEDPNWGHVFNDSEGNKIYQSKVTSRVFYTPATERISDNDFAVVCDVGSKSLWSGAKLIKQVMEKIGYVHKFPYVPPTKPMIIEIPKFDEIEVVTDFKILRFPQYN